MACPFNQLGIEKCNARSLNTFPLVSPKCIGHGLVLREEKECAQCSNWKPVVGVSPGLPSP
jgi:hypothetical protein